VDELLTSEGRAVLERLVREHGAQRARIVAALVNGWRCADDSPLTEDDLSQLLEVHGLARGFERRERDELLHALRAAAGVRTRAAAASGLAPAAWDAALERLGAIREAETIRAAHREELRRRATLSERVRMLLGETERLEDLGLLAEIEADVRARLPEHVRALRASGAAPLGAALARSLAVGPADIGRLVARLGLELDGSGRGAGAPGQVPGQRIRRGHAPGRAGTSRTMRQPAGSARRPGAGQQGRGQQGRGQQGDRAGAGDARRKAFRPREAAAPGHGRPKPGSPRPARGARRRPKTKRS
jgi:hypothetical protein